MVRKKPTGWKGESRRHSLAALRGHRRKKYITQRKKTYRKSTTKKRRVKRR